MVMFGKAYHLLLNLTWRCTNSCPYCWQVLMGRNAHLTPYDNPKEHDWIEWTRILDDFPPCIIDLSGGEPLLYDGLASLVNNLNRKHLLALSSNLNPTNGFSDLLKLHNRFVSVTASWHKTGSLSTSEFVKRVKMLSAEGFPVSVNIVRHSTYDLSFLVRDWWAVKKLRQLGIKVNFSPFEDPRTITTTCKKLICNAGMNTFVIAPAGDVYRCLTWFRYRGRDQWMLGNIFDGTFKPLKERQPCDLLCDNFYTLNREHSQKDMFSTHVEELAP